MLSRESPVWVALPLQRLALTFRLLGWLGFWVQLVMAFIAGVSLVLAIIGLNSTYSTGAGVFWAVCGLLLLVAGLLIDIQNIRTARGLRHDPGTTLHPKRHNTIRLLRFAALVGFVGMMFALMGSGTSVIVLLAKTVSQPPGVAIIDPSKIIRTLDVLVVAANLTLIAAHLLGTVIPFWLLDQVHHYEIAHQQLRSQQPKALGEAHLADS